TDWCGFGMATDGNRRGVAPSIMVNRAVRRWMEMQVLDGSGVVTARCACVGGNRRDSADVSYGVADVEAAALNARVDPLCAALPQTGIRTGQRIHFNVREVEASVAQRRERDNRSLQKIGAEL